MGLADAFLEVAKIEFFYDEAPESMKSLRTSYSMKGLGAGNFINSFLLSIVSRITKKRGHDWIQNNLNLSNLDYYYTFSAILNILNPVFLLIMAKFNVYKDEVSDSLAVLKEELKGLKNNRNALEEESRRG